MCHLNRTDAGDRWPGRSAITPPLSLSPHAPTGSCLIPFAPRGPLIATCQRARLCVRRRRAAAAFDSAEDASLPACNSCAHLLHTHAYSKHTLSFCLPDSHIQTSSWGGGRTVAGNRRWSLPARNGERLKSCEIVLYFCSNMPALGPS